MMHFLLLIAISMVSVNSNGVQGDDDSWAPGVNANGRFIAFNSYASNFVNVPDFCFGEVYIRDRDADKDAVYDETGSSATKLISVGKQISWCDPYPGHDAIHYLDPPAISNNGRFIAFTWYSYLLPLYVGNTTDVFVRDRATGQTIRASVDSTGVSGNDRSRHPSISADGRYVVFDSWASNLIVTDDNQRPDVFVHDMQTGTTTRVSVAADGTESNDLSWSGGISADGRYIAFDSDADNVVTDDTNHSRDIFIRDMQTGEIKRISLNAKGEQSNLGSQQSDISADGQSVAFVSGSSDIIKGDTNRAQDVFVYSQQTGQVTCASLDAQGSPSNGASLHPSISGDGRFVAFYSLASDLVDNDTNSSADIFVHDNTTGKTAIVSTTYNSAPTTDLFNIFFKKEYASPNISADGSTIVFSSISSDMVPGDTNNHEDVFVVVNPLF